VHHKICGCQQWSEICGRSERQHHAPIGELVDCGGQCVRFGAVVKGYVRAMRSRKSGDRLPSSSSAEHNHVGVAEAPPCNGVGLKIGE
jgi:hypothetical protein